MTESVTGKNGGEETVLKLPSLNPRSDMLPVVNNSATRRRKLFKNKGRKRERIWLKVWWRDDKIRSNKGLNHHQNFDQWFKIS